MLSAVKSIKRQHLVEIRTMANPPPIVKMALESICLLLGEPVTALNDWKTFRTIVIRENFVPNIISLRAEDIA